MSTKRILFPTDFSRTADATLPVVTSLARDRDAEVVILHVQEPPTHYAAGEWYYGPIEPDVNTLKQLLHEIKPADPRVLYRHRLAQGDPPIEIVRVAQEEGADMIVMSTHGRTGLTRALMGSVAEAVVRRADCPVLTVKQRHEKK